MSAFDGWERDEWPRHRTVGAAIWTVAKSCDIWYWCYEVDSTPYTYDESDDEFTTPEAALADLLAHHPLPEVTA